MTEGTLPPTATRNSRRPRKRLSCELCRSSKLRCDRRYPCGTCQRRNRPTSCSYRKYHSNIVSGTSPRPHQHLVLGPPLNLDPNLSPGYTGENLAEHVELSPVDNEDSALSQWDNMFQQPALSRQNTSLADDCTTFSLTFGPAVPKVALLAGLPTPDCCDYLVSEYFMYSSPMFHILHGPTFQIEYSSFIQDRKGVSLSWLALLLAMCSLGMDTIDPDDPAILGWLSSQQDYPHHDTVAVSRRLRGLALSCLSQDNFLVHYDLNTLEALLILIYSICHNEGVERGWTLLGIALNIGIAMKVNRNSDQLNYIEGERRRRCWAGILMLYTYQGILFRDTDMASLLNIQAVMPVVANDCDIRADSILPTSSQSTGMTLMRYKIRLFHLSTQLCSQHLRSDTLDEYTLQQLSDSIAREQEQWDAAFMVAGVPSVLDAASYAHWCILQSYADQLYLIIHQPFHRSRSPHFRPESRDACLKASMALIDIHRKFCDLPRLRRYRWLVRGMTSFNALQGAIALASCLLDLPSTFDNSFYRGELDALSMRMKSLQGTSPVCKKACSILCNLRTYLNDRLGQPGPEAGVQETPDDRVDFDWFDTTAANWDFWVELMNDSAETTAA